VSWRAGREAVDHTVSYSTDEQAVIDGTAASDTVSQTSYGPLSLDLGSVYYWRVDSVGTSDTWPGDIWSFRTEQYIIVEDFEFYDDDDPNRIWDAWADGWDDDNNGSTIGYPDPDFDNDEHFVEVTVVHNGDQSGPVLYDNTAPVNYSEALLVFDAAQDWTSNAADEVVINFRGNAVTFQETDDGYIAMSGEGADIWTNDDQFRYAYKTLTGNGSMIVRLDSLEELNTYTKAGIMIRETMDANSVMVLSTFHANDTTTIQSRDETDAQATQADVATDIELPVWLKLTREGDTFTGERSSDGVNWEPIGDDPNTPNTVEVTMPNTVYIGLAVCSHVADTLAAATFYGVETSGGVSGDWTVVAVGDTEQAEGDNTLDELYMALEDSSGNRHDVYAPVTTATGWGNWYEWIIPQSEFSDNGVDMARIKKIIVGVGDPADPMNGSGMIFIDDIGYGHTVVEQ
jgi:hypothetical protein